MLFQQFERWLVVGYQQLMRMNGSTRKVSQDRLQHQVGNVVALQGGTRASVAPVVLQRGVEIEKENNWSAWIRNVMQWHT